MQNSTVAFLSFIAVGLFGGYVVYHHEKNNANHINNGIIGAWVTGKDGKKVFKKTGLPE